MRAIAILLAFLLLPQALATAGGSFEHDGVQPVGAWAASIQNRYGIHANAGEVIRVTLTWDDPNAFLDLHYTASPGDSGCPITNIPCLANDVPGDVIGNIIACNHRDDGTLNGSPLIEDQIVDATGIWTLNVKTGFAAQAVPYHISIQINNGGHDRAWFAGERGQSHGAPTCTLGEELVWGPVRNVG